MPQTKFLRKDTELWDLLTSDRYIVKDVEFPTEQLAQVSFVEQDEFVVEGINTNVVIAAFTTAYARMKLYQSVLPLGQAVCYMDTGMLVKVYMWIKTVMYIF